MSGISSYLTPGRVNKINLLCLLLAICWILFLPLKKEIWYDETVSVLISKGFSHDSPAEFASHASATNETLAQLNTTSNVYHATLVDNGNSFLYNICLHWFTGICGNSLTVYVLFSKICAAAALLAFFVLCSLFFESSIFTAVAIILFASDKIFWGMAHEIRAYEMGMFFIILSAINWFRYMYRAEKPMNLFLTGLFAACAILCHYLSVYAVLVFIGYLVATKKAKLFTAKNILALLIPVAIIGVYFYGAAFAFGNMNRQNLTIKAKTISEGFSVAQVAIRSMKFAALNFKFIYPAVKGNTAVVVLSFLMVIGTYIAALKFSTTKEQKRNLNLLFILGFSSSIFLGVLSLKAHHYTPLYSRYYSFSVPFCTLFVAYALKVIVDAIDMKAVVAGAATALIIIPCCALFVLGNVKNAPILAYNHIPLAKTIVNDNIAKVEVPNWAEAFLVSSFLPADHKIEYVLNNTAYNFVLYKPAGIETIPVIRIDN